MTGKSLRAFARFAAAALCVTLAASAQVPSNASLKGAYYVRYLGEDTRSAGTMSFSGTMTFDGAGNYTLSGQGANSKTSDKILKFNPSGTYNIYSNGMVALDNPFDTSNSASGPIFGGLGTGILTGSSTEGVYCDMFVALPASTSNSAASLSGTYNMASLEFLNGDLNVGTRNTFFQVSADGKGGLGNVTIKGTAQSLSDQPTVQTSANATYTVTANGTGTLTLPAPSGVAANNVLLSGNKVLYAAADGSFFIAGGATTWDFVIGTKQASGASFNGIYFSAYLQNYATGSSGDGVYAVSGSTNGLASINKIIAHERTNSENYYPYDYTYSDTLQFSADGSAIAVLQVLGAGGNLLIGSSTGGNYLLSIYAKSVPSVPTGTVVLYPQGIVNAANNVPFTSQYSPGEVVTLYGSGFTTQTLSAGLPFPTTLGGVQVNIAYTDANNTKQTVAAPIYFVSPGQISAVLPYTIPNDGTSITFSVTSNGTKSNESTVYSGPVSPGIFTIPVGGLGDGAVLHADYSLVTAANPAKSGETIQIFLTGLGMLDKTVTAGAAGPTNPLANAVIPVDVGLRDPVSGNFYDGKIVFSGLAPGLGGIYQVNVTLPSGLPTGQVIISIYCGDGSDYGDGWNEMATLQVAK